MPIIAAGIAGLGDLIGGGLAAGFGALDAGAAALGAGAAGAGALGALDAGAATAGTIGAADVGTTLGAGLGAGGAAGAIDTGAGLATTLAGPASGGVLADLGLSATPDALSAFGQATDPFTAGIGVEAGPSLGYNAPLDATGVTGTGADVASTISPVGTGTAMDASIFPGANAGAVTGATQGGTLATLPGAAGAGAGAGGIDTTTGLATSLAGPSSTPAGGGSILDTLTGSIAKNPLGAAGTAVAGAGLLKTLIGGAPKYPEAGQLQGLNSQTQQLLSDFRSGKLPPGFAQAIQQSTNAANAATIQSYASQGKSTDPRYNTALARDLQANQENAIAMTAKIGQTILQSGLSAVQLDQGILQSLLNLDTQQTAATGQAISNFAAALGSLGRGTGAVNINLPAGTTVG